MGRVLFISDLHLAPEEPGTADRFFEFLRDIEGKARALYILGDLFEIWIGDDELEAPFQAGISRAIRTLVDSGTAVAIMHGNRDFLLGSAFLAATGATLLPDPCVIDLNGEATLLLHGDSLCIDDHAYQDFRQQVRDPAWQKTFLNKPIDERRAIARKYREDSRDAQTGKAKAILDVNPDAVRQAFLDFKCRRMIHGHTHRPARHLLAIDGQPHERWVLPDWYGDGGGYLACTSRGCSLQELVTR